MATRQWIVSADGTYSFNATGDWQSGIVPNALDIAQFNVAIFSGVTITGDASIAELLFSQGIYNLAGNYTISGTQLTELSVTTPGITAGRVTILPGASVNGTQAVVVSGTFASLTVGGALAAGSLTVTGGGGVTVVQGSAFAISGTISLNDGGLSGKSQSGLAGGPAIAIDNSIVLSATNILASAGRQETDFNGVISGAGALILGSDSLVGETIALNGNNSFSGGASIVAGGLTVAAGNANVFGTGTLTISGGELLATTTETIANALTLTPAFAIAAAHGQTLTIGTGAWTLNPNNASITFGGTGQDGTVIFKNTGGHTINAGAYTIVVQAGTLKSGGDIGVQALVNGASSVTLNAGGATLDSAGFAMTIDNLQGAGRLTNSGALAALLLAGPSPEFSGTIDGAFAVTVAGGVSLAGSNTYTGGTTITGGNSLTLGIGGASGSVTGNITDNGTLVFDRSDAFTINNVSGTGQLELTGSGTATLGASNSYSGGNILAGGTLAVGNPAALGSGNLHFAGGELLATATETISSPNAVYFGENGNRNDRGTTLAAAHGQTLTFNPVDLHFGADNGGGDINFGAVGQDGVVALKKGTTVHADHAGILRAVIPLTVKSPITAARSRPIAGLR